MKTTILFVQEVTIKAGEKDELDLVKIRFADKFDGFKQDSDGNFEQARIDEVLMYRSAFFAQVFASIPLLSLAYARTEKFATVKAALLNAKCDLIRELVAVEDQDYNRYNTSIENIEVDEVVKKLLDNELSLAFS